MKVLWIIPGIDSGSSMIFAKRQCQDLQKFGVNGDMFFLGSKQDPLSLYRTFRSALRFGRESGVTCVHAQYGTFTAFFSSILAFMLGARLFITCRGSDINYCPADGFFRNILQKFCTYFASLTASQIFVVSEELKNKFWWKWKTIIVTPSGVNFEEFKPLVRATCRERLVWSASEKIILFNAGKTPRLKRIDLAVAAINILKQSNENVRLEILTGNVKPEEMIYYLNAADVVLMTSDHEGSPGIVKEALACNIPVVSVDVGDVAKRIKNISGCFLTTRNPSEIAATLHRVLSTPTSVNSREIIFSELSSNVIARSIAATY